ncbi:hypothetical protein ACFE04_015958 [Oxalis oulophora]
MRYNTASLANVVVIVLSLLLLLFPCSSCYKVKLRLGILTASGRTLTVTPTLSPVTSPTGNIVLKVNETPEDKFEFKPPTPGLYKFWLRYTRAVLATSPLFTCFLFGTLKALELVYIHWLFNRCKWIASALHS